jgi:hypothetical protein
LHNTQKIKAHTKNKNIEKIKKTVISHWLIISDVCDKWDKCFGRPLQAFCSWGMFAYYHPSVVRNLHRNRLELRHTVMA